MSNKNMNTHYDIKMSNTNMNIQYDINTNRFVFLNATTKQYELLKTDPVLIDQVDLLNNIANLILKKLAAVTSETCKTCIHSYLVYGVEISCQKSLACWDEGWCKNYSAKMT